MLRGDADAAARFRRDECILAFRDESADGRPEEACSSPIGPCRGDHPAALHDDRAVCFSGMVTESGDLIIMAVRRGEEQIAPDPAHEQCGSSSGRRQAAFQGTWKALDINLSDPDVLVVDSPELVRRQAVPLGPGAKQAIAILIVMVIAARNRAHTGGGGGPVGGRRHDPRRHNHALIRHIARSSWTTVILVGAMMPLSTAMEQPARPT